MRKLFRAASVLLLAVLLFSVGSTSVVSADPCSAGTDPLGCACSGNGSDSPACSGRGNGTTDPIAGQDGALVKAAKIIALFAGIAAVIIIIIAGLMIVLAGGDSQRVANARSSIIGALVGAVVIIAAAGIITFVVSKIS